MINVTIYKGTDCYRGFKMEGHAGYADSGSDIVCAAASVLAINTVNSIEQFSDDAVDVKLDEQTGLLELLFKSSVSDVSNLFIGSLALGVKTIIENYSEKYIQLSFKEV